MKLSGADVLVTGGAGFIGSHLVDLLIKEGCRVRVIDNLANGRKENLKQHEGNGRFEFIKGDINDDCALSGAVSGADMVFHLACLGVRHSIKHPVENHRVNAEGTLKVLQQAYTHKVKRFLYCSSSEAYGTAIYVPMAEEHPTLPRTVYGAGKLAGEAYARAYYLTYGMETLIVRPFNTYGPRSHHEGDAGEMIPKSIVRAISGQPILVFGDGSQTRDFTYVKDMAKGIYEAACCDKAVGLTLNIGSGFEISIGKIAAMILKLTGNSSKIENLDPRPGDVLRLYADAAKFKKMTEWKSETVFDDGLRMTVEWFKSRPEGPAALLSQEDGINWR